MPSPNQPVQPTPFEAPQPPEPQSTAGGPSGGSQGHPPWLLVALAVLVVMAIAVFTWLPGQVDPPPAAPVVNEAPARVAASSPRDGAPAAAQADAGEAEVESSPWEESLRAKMRQQAQSVLEPLLDRQFELEELGVEQWAAEEFNNALGQAASGDELYRQREFEAATERYREALAAMEAILASLPERIESLLAQANESLEGLDQAGALAALDTVDIMSPGTTTTATLRERAALQPQLVDAFNEAAEAETAGQLVIARDRLADAKAIDPTHQRAGSEFDRISEALTTQQYQQAMSRGYVALANNELAEARAAFSAATALQPDAREAQEALAQVGTAKTGARLASLQAEGKRLEQGEQWQQATTTYRKALELDSSVLFAREGLARSEPRAQLDKQLREALADPLRLSSTAIARETAQLLAQAKAATPRGPVLAVQIESLDKTLKLASTPVQVTLRSDTQTEVTVYKVARLGRFQQHELQLRPGRYTAVGQRSGYRDVRESFTIEPGASSLTVTIACTEAI